MFNDYCGLYFESLLLSTVLRHLRLYQLQFISRSTVAHEFKWSCSKVFCYQLYNNVYHCNSSIVYLTRSAVAHEFRLSCSWSRHRPPQTLIDDILHNMLRLPLTIDCCVAQLASHSRAEIQSVENCSHRMTANNRRSCVY